MTATAKILFICSHLVGRLRSIDTLATRLRADGHKVILAVPPPVKKHLNTSSEDVVEIDDFNLGGAQGEAPSSLRDFLPSQRRKRLSDLENRVNTGSVKKLIQSEAPDLVVIDYEMHPHIIAALGTLTPVALFTTHFITQPSSHNPPLHTTLVPGRDSSVAIWRAWIKIWIKLRKKTIKTWIATGGTDYLSLLKHMAKEEGFDLRRHTTRWWWQTPCFWRSLPLIIAQSPALDFSTDYDSQLRHVGPMLPPTNPNDTYDDDEAIKYALRERNRGKRVVYISFGSAFKAEPNVVANTWKAIGNYEDAVAIQSTGGRKDFKASHAPKNVLLVDWAPQNKLLQLCDAAIMHGGVNTLTECIATDTPVLSIPGGIDQPGTTARIVYHGLGLACSKRSATEEIGKALRRLLDDPSFRKRCAEMRHAFEVLERDMKAEKIFQELLNETKSTAPARLRNQRK